MYTPIETENDTLPAQPCALPDSWVGRIFDHMANIYGSKLADLWSGSNQESVRRMWAEKLGGFRSMPGAIKEALDALDSKPFPPTLPEFLAMCREAGRRHASTVAKLEHKTTQEERERADEFAKKLSSVVTSQKSDHRHWAKVLKKRHEAGDRLSMVQISAYQEALSVEAA